MKKGQKVYLGSFETAVEAAVCYARHALSQQAEEAEVVEEAEGLRLHLSSNNSTGYKGVRNALNGGNKPYAAQICVQGKGQVYLGSFKTAVEAAVCYARHALAQQGSSSSSSASATAAASPSSPPPNLATDT